MDMNDVFQSEWFGVLGAGVIAAVITAEAMPFPSETPSSISVEEFEFREASLPQAVERR